MGITGCACDPLKRTMWIFFTLGIAAGIVYRDPRCLQSLYTTCVTAAHERAWDAVCLALLVAAIALGLLGGHGNMSEETHGSLWSNLGLNEVMDMCILELPTESIACCEDGSQTSDLHQPSVSGESTRINCASSFTTTKEALVNSASRVANEEATRCSICGAEPIINSVGNDFIDSSVTPDQPAPSIQHKDAMFHLMQKAVHRRRNISIFEGCAPASVSETNQLEPLQMFAIDERSGVPVLADRKARIVALRDLNIEHESTQQLQPARNRPYSSPDLLYEDETNFTEHSDIDRRADAFIANFHEQIRRDMRHEVPSFT